MRANFSTTPLTLPGGRGMWCSRTTLERMRWQKSTQSWNWISFRMNFKVLSTSCFPFWSSWRTSRDFTLCSAVHHIRCHWNFTTGWAKGKMYWFTVWQELTGKYHWKLEKKPAYGRHQLSTDADSRTDTILKRFAWLIFIKKKLSPHPSSAKEI